MKILVLNCGSSSIKYKLFDMSNSTVIAQGGIEKIGLQGSFLKLTLPNGAFIECYYIQKHKPKYNILLKDDKKFPYFVITKEDYPKILVIRKANKNPIKGKYYGPYTDIRAMHATLEIINKMTNGLGEKGLFGSVTKLLTIFGVFKMGMAIFKKFESPLTTFFKKIVSMFRMAGEESGREFVKGA